MATRNVRTPVPRLVPVESSFIRAVGYDKSANELYVELLDGDTYVYSLVGARKHRELMAADSVGGYFNREIRTKHGHRQL